MLVKHLKRVKRFREERDLSLNSDGFIGKLVSYTPTLLGIFILRQYYSEKNLIYYLKNGPVSRVTNRKNSQKIILVCEK